MAGDGYPNGRGRLGFRIGGVVLETRDGRSNSASEVNQDVVRAMPGVIDCPNCNKDGAITDGFPNKEGSYQSGSLYARDKTRAQESINNIQNAAGDGGRTGFPAGIFRRQQFDYGGYESGANDMSTNRWNPPAYGRYDSSPYNVSTEPTLISKEGWTRPSHAGWATSPEVPLGKATNDIGTAAEYLRESARPSPGAMAGMGRRNPAWPNTYQPRRESVTTTIDSREAAKKYGGMFV